MNKTTAMVLLIVFGNLLILTLGTAQIFLMSIRPPVLGIVAIIALFAMHNAAVRFSRKRFERRFGVSAKRYILTGVLPAAAICVLLFITANVLMSFGIYSFLLWSIDSIPLEWIFLLFASGYSIFFLAAQFVILAREIW